MDYTDLFRRLLDRILENHRNAIGFVDPLRVEACWEDAESRTIDYLRYQDRFTK